ncbi:hypothetical protein [Streptomyces acidiscabies]|uniref:hypothetical protein n=1 Tax=Streptomyces acidiscabies TaxID=42234 RepID=UPI00117FF069|nr:hypothetical protein [Streptomyces acidiscabies]
MRAHAGPSGHRPTVRRSSIPATLDGSRGTARPPGGAVARTSPGVRGGASAAGNVRLHVDGQHRERLPDAVLELLDAVESAADRGESLTVTDAATALGVDQPSSSIIPIGTSSSAG